LPSSGPLWEWCHGAAGRTSDWIGLGSDWNPAWAGIVSISAAWEAAAARAGLTGQFRSADKRAGQILPRRQAGFV